MANKPLPRIYCNSCNKTQDYRGQANCIHCGRRLNNWSVASQLKVQQHQRRRDSVDETAHAVMDIINKHK